MNFASSCSGIQAFYLLAGFVIVWTNYQTLWSIIILMISTALNGVSLISPLHFSFIYSNDQILYMILSYLLSLDIQFLSLDFQRAPRSLRLTSSVWKSNGQGFIRSMMINPTPGSSRVGLGNRGPLLEARLGFDFIEVSTLQGPILCWKRILENAYGQKYLTRVSTFYTRNFKF